MKPRSILFSVIAMCALVAFSSSVANAQESNPSASETAAARQAGPCRDPWVSMAIRRATGRAPHGQGDIGECYVNLYNGGSWSSYSELVQAVRFTQGRLAEGRVSFDMTRTGNGQARISLINEGSVVDSRTVRLIGPDGATLIGNDAGSLIGNDAGSLISNSNSRFTVQSVGNEKRINLGKRVLVIRKR